jgi:hypothetical protein
MLMLALTLLCSPGNRPLRPLRESVRSEAGTISPISSRREEMGCERQVVDMANIDWTWLILIEQSTQQLE